VTDERRAIAGERGTDDERRVTEEGNPARPTGEYGARMLRRMNDSHAEVTDWALDYLDFDSSDSVLDIGCGGGATMRRISERMGEGTGHVTGLDYSEVSCEESRLYNASDIEQGRMSVVQASVADMPFDDASFDLIVTVESFYFWPNPQESLAEVRRVLKRGGRFALVADIYGKPDLPDDVLENIEKYSLNVPTPDEYRALFDAAGFSECVVHTRRGTDWICVEGVA
jgi:ubiquinone/menaquinone biosynthesis C-methylase UbiE